LSLGRNGIFYLGGKRVNTEFINEKKTDQIWKDVQKEDLDGNKKPKKNQGKESPQDNGY
jgi:hypothetical protein